MNNQEILDQLKIFMTYEEEITLNTPCEALLDSLGFIQLILQAESLFGITINDDELVLRRYIVMNDFIDMIKLHIREGM